MAGQGATLLPARPTAGASALRQLWQVLSPADRRQLVLLIPMVVVMALLETAGVASIVPFLGLLSDKDALAKNAALAWGYETFAFASRESFFFAVGVCCLALFILGNAWSTLTSYRLVTFSTMRSANLSTRLLDAYLRQSYAFFLQKNSADLAKNILTEVGSVVTGVLGQLVNLSARLVVVGAILATLVVVDLRMALGVSVVFGGVYGAIYFLLRRSATLLGRERVALNSARFQIAQEALGGVKELKLYGLENIALRTFDDVAERFARLQARNAVTVQLPRYAIESVAFGGVLLMVLLWLDAGRPLDDLLPVLGLYAFAAYRLLPSLQTIFAGLNSIRFNLGSLEVLTRDLVERQEGQEARPDVVERLPFSEGLSLDSVSFRYEGATRQTLDTVTLRQAPGEWIALVGPTGAGKSTIVDLMLGVLSPDAGQVRADDVVLDDAVSKAGWQRNVAYVPQSIFLVDDTVLRNIAFGEAPTAIDRERAIWAAKVAQIDAFISQELPDGYDTVVGERGMRLSGGQRQRLGIARALYRQPRYLVLDEATSALDNQTEAAFFEALRTGLKDVAVVSIAHRLSTTRSFDRIFVMENGRMVDEGTFSDLSKRSPHFRVSDAA